MTEKDNDSMATVQIKPDYAASEVYSTASEPPPIGLFNFNQPAYKRQSNSVKIAKITAFTVIVSSFILGSFILASSYLQAKSSCDQVQALDSVLEKELMLETLQQVNKELPPPPRAEALLAKQHNDDADLQNINELDEQPIVKKINFKEQQADSARPVENAPAAGETDSTFSENEETEDLQKVPGKVPFEFDLSDLAAALLQNQHKSRMNCVVERKRAEEVVDSPSKTVALPFGMNLTTDPKKARVTGERISIFCDGGNENKDQPQGRQNNRETDEDDDTDEDAEPIRPMFIPYQRIPIPFGPHSNQFPLTHLPQRMMPPMQQQMIHQMPPPFQQLPIRPPMPHQVMQAPHPEAKPQQQTIRIHVPIREIHMANDVPVQIPASHQELPHFQVQQVPLDIALQRAGITPEDLQNIQRIAEDRYELRRLNVEENADSDSENNNSSEEDNQSQQSSQGSRENEQQQQQQHPQQQQQPQPHMHLQLLTQQMLREQPPQHLILQKQQLPEQPRDTMVPPMPDQPQPLMQFGRAIYGRSLAQPVRIPVPMMQAQADMSQETNEPERPHLVQPRSIRTTELFKSEN